MVKTGFIHQMDIQPKGFNVIRMDGEVTSERGERTREVRDVPDQGREMVERNGEITCKWDSCQALTPQPGDLIEDGTASPAGCDP